MVADVVELLYTTIIPFLLLFSAIVFIHEYGHYAAARIFKIPVREFALGFGPVLWKRQGRHNLWSFRALPLGGFVRVEEEGPNGFNSISPYKRIAIALAGPAVNLAAAFMLFFTIYLNGAAYWSPVISAVVPGSPAQAAGLLVKDEIVAVNGITVSSADEVMASATLGRPTVTDVFTIRRLVAGAPETLSVAVPRNGGRYGIFFEEHTAKGDVVGAVKTAAAQLTTTAQAIVRLPFLVHSSGGDPVSVFSGPVGIAQITGEVVRSQSPIEMMLVLCAHLNLGIALVNMIPVPLFDGGRIVFYLIEAASNRPTNPKVHQLAAGLSFIFVVMVGVVITANDLVRVFGL